MNSQPSEPPIAHSRNSAGVRQPLVDHLQQVADMAAQFATAFSAAQLAYYGGLWHDLGKFDPAFQTYLGEAEANPEHRRRGPGHKAAGACFAARQGPLQSLAIVIAGHHGGLPDRASGLLNLLAENRDNPAVEEALAAAARTISELTPEAVVPLPPFVGERLRTEFFLRMLFSTLVDADFLDTEAHFQPELTGARGSTVDVATLWDTLRRHQESTSGKQSDLINQIRHEVYQSCVAAASQAPGFFRLTVPTGGGKTLSGLAFALRHAMEHQLDRVIVAVPYTSITEQTAAVYRSVFSEHPRAVLEHHSAVPAVESEQSEDGALPNWRRLAAENWDAPLIVTTTVQLFESLLGRSTSACRKLHNIARSVIILDEVQTLPTGLLSPTLDVLTDLVEHYGVSVVLCSATQPALEARSGFAGLENIREIVPAPEQHFRRLRRVSYEWASDDPWSWERVAGEIQASPQVLTIVNTKQDALTLLAALDDPEVLHLSTLLCGAHRRNVLREVGRRLSAGEPCRVVATQVVEAGVDLDFPVVLRALGPLDRIVQAAGRCNRNNRLARGRVVVFAPESGGLPPGAYRTATELTASRLASPDFDFDDPEAYRAFFQEYFTYIPHDAAKVQEFRAAFNYPEVASRYRLIPDDTVPLLVRYKEESEGVEPYDQIMKRVDRAEFLHRNLWRQLQPYLVSVYAHWLNRHQSTGLVDEIRPGLWKWTGDYDLQVGLGRGVPDPERSIF